MSKAPIKDPSIELRPSPQLIDFIKTLDDFSVALPENLLNVYQSFSQDTRPRDVCPKSDIDSISDYTDEEKKLMFALSDDAFQGTTDLQKCFESLCVRTKHDDSNDDSLDSDVETLAPNERISKNKARQMRAKQRLKEMSKLTLNLTDLKWLYKHLNEARQNDPTVPYLHKLVEGSQLILPPNEIIERNQELEARCQRLKLEQDEQKYRQMTRNVDCTRTTEPTESISYQGKRQQNQLTHLRQISFHHVTCSHPYFYPQ